MFDSDGHKLAELLTGQMSYRNSEVWRVAANKPLPYRYVHKMFGIGWCEYWVRRTLSGLALFEKAVRSRCIAGLEVAQCEMPSKSITLPRAGKCSDETTARCSIGPVSGEASKRLPICRGTGSSNPSPSSGESPANLSFRAGIPSMIVILKLSVCRSHLVWLRDVMLGE
jgi:hypothetical protein